MRKKGKIKEQKKLIKLHIEIISKFDKDFSEFIILNKKDYNEFECNKTYITSIENLLEVEPIYGRNYLINYLQNLLYFLKKYWG